MRREAHQPIFSRNLRAAAAAGAATPILAVFECDASKNNADEGICFINHYELPD